MDKTFEYISELRNAIDRDKLIVFIGAGFSNNVEGMPTWKELIIAMDNEIGNINCQQCKDATKNCKDTCKCINDYSSDDFIKIPQYLYNSDKSTYKQIISDQISNQTQKSEIHELLFKLNPKHIITTNYDKLIEDNRPDETYYDVLWNDQSLLNSINNKHILKIHGDIGDEESIILKEDDYLTYSQTHILTETYIKSLLIDHKLLFLGYSLNDYNIKLIISWINYLNNNSDNINENTSLGYLVLDEKNLNDHVVKNHDKNNLTVVNINTIEAHKKSLYLKTPIGQRLYTFMKILIDETLDTKYYSNESLTKKLNYLLALPYVSNRSLCDYLNIKQYLHLGNNLHFMDPILGEYWIAILNEHTKNSKHLKLLFLKAGVSHIFSCHTFVLNIDSPFGEYDKIGDLYLKNKYVELYEELDTENNLLKKAFYLNERSIYGEDIKLILNSYRTELPSLSIHQKLTLHFNTFKLNCFYDLFNRNLSEFIALYENIPSHKEKRLFKFYDNFLNRGNTDVLTMKNNLSKLKEHYNSLHSIYGYGGDLYQLYLTQNIAYDYYYCHRKYFIMEEYIGDIKDILFPYIESMLCANGINTTIVKKSSYGDRKPQIYCLNTIDLDIITKYVFNAELLKLITEYKVEKINVSDKKHLVAITINYINSLSKLSYWHNHETSGVLTNLLTIVYLAEIDNSDMIKIFDAFILAYENQNSLKTFFTNSFRSRYSIKAIFEFLMILTPTKTYFKFVKTIIDDTKVFNSIKNNIDYYGSEFFFYNLIGERFLDDQQQNIYELIENIQDNQHKVNVIICLHKSITDDSYKVMCKQFLSTNIDLIPSSILLNLLRQKMILTNESVEQVLLKRTLQDESMGEKGLSFGRAVPLLDICIIGFLNGYIKNLSPISEYENKSNVLSFLLHPDKFDYNKIDFAELLWKHVLRSQKYLYIIVSNKEKFIDKLKMRLTKDIATEYEKVLFYKYLSDETTQWDYTFN